AQSPAPSVITLNAPTPAAGLSTLSVAAGNGDVTLNVSALPAGVANTIRVGNESNSITIASAGLVGTSSTMVSGGSGLDTLIYDANGNSSNVTSQTVSAGSGSLSQQTLVSFDHIDQLQIINSPDLPLVGIPLTITTNQGTPFNGVTVASFTDTDPNA